MCEQSMIAAKAAAQSADVAAWLKDGSERQILSHSDICTRITQAIQSRIPVRFDATIAGEMQAMVPMLVAEVMAVSQVNPELADQLINDAADQIVSRVRDIATAARIRRDQLTMQPTKVAARKRVGSRVRLRQSQIELGNGLQMDGMADDLTLSGEDREHVLASVEMLLADGVVAEGVTSDGEDLRIQLPGDELRYALIPLTDLQLIEVKQVGGLYQITHRAHPVLGLGVHYHTDREMTLSREAIELITGHFYSAGDLAEKLRDNAAWLDSLWELDDATRGWRHGRASANDNDSMAFYGHQPGADKMQPMVA